MKTLLLVVIVAVTGACTVQHKAAQPARPTVSSVSPECVEIPTLTGKPMRCEAVKPDALRAQ